MAEKKVLKGYFQRVCFLKHTILKSFWKDRIPPYQLKVSRLGGMRVGFSCPSLLQVPVCKPVPKQPLNLGAHGALFRAGRAQSYRTSCRWPWRCQAARPLQRR